MGEPVRFHALNLRLDAKIGHNGRLTVGPEDVPACLTVPATRDRRPGPIPSRSTMNLPLGKLLGSLPSQEAAGWGTSVVLHVTGFLFASATFVSTLGDLPELAGRQTAANVELTATWTEEEPQPPEPVEIVPPDPPVVVMPDRVHMAEQTYVPTSTDVTEPTPAELAMVDRMMAAPPSSEPRAPIDRPPPRERTERQPTREVKPARLPTVSQPLPTVGTSPDTPARLLDNHPPTYPARAVRARLEGTTLLRVKITAEGTVADLELIATSGHSILDAAAVSAVRTWRFLPAASEGRPTETTVRLPVRFSLDQR